MTTYYDYDDDLRRAEFRCDRCGQRTPDAKGVHLFAESICAECADVDEDEVGEYDPPCHCGTAVGDHPTIYVNDEFGDYETQACPGSIVCALCDAHLFVAGVEHGDYIWSHLEDTGCDDPVPTTTKA